MIWAVVLCVFATTNAADGWVQVRSKNFFVIGDAPEPDLRQTAARLERFRQTILHLFPQIKLDGGIKTNVVVFKNAASYTPFKPKRADGSVDEIVRGYFLAGEDVNYIAVADPTTAYGTIFHEYLHFLLDVNIGRTDLPPWLGEGLAEYFETVQFQEDGRVFIGTPPAGHVAALRKSELTPLPTFFAADNASLHQGDEQSRSFFYVQAWALIHYLLHAKPEGREVRFDELLSSARSQDAPDRVAKGLFGQDPAVLARSVRHYLDQKNLPSRTIHLPPTAAGDAQMSSAQMTEAEAAAYQGDLLHHNSELARAEAYLRRAVKLDPHLTVANASLGLLLVRRGDFADGRRYLENAINADEANHFAHFHYAQALSRESMDDDGWVSEFPSETEAKMRNSFRRAIELNPAFSESYRLLAFVNFVNDKDLDEAVALLNKGLSLRPGDQDMSMLLARVLLRQEKYTEARAIAKKLADAAASPQVWSDAREVLRAVDQYFVIKSAGTADPEAARIFGPIPPLILKRSALTEEEVANYERDREINNLNVYLPRPRFGERQIVGHLEKITCRDGTINYVVRAGKERFSLTSDGFAGVGMLVLTQGQSSYTLDCGVGFGSQLTVLTFIQGPKVNVRGRLVSIAFVPDIFRLKTPEEMATRRTVIIEDDRAFKNRERTGMGAKSPEN